MFGFKILTVANQEGESVTEFQVTFKGEVIESGWVPVDTARRDVEMLAWLTAEEFASSSALMAAVEGI